MRPAGRALVLFAATVAALLLAAAPAARAARLLRDDNTLQEDMSGAHNETFHAHSDADSNVAAEGSAETGASSFWIVRGGSHVADAGDTARRSSVSTTIGVAPRDDVAAGAPVLSVVNPSRPAVVTGGTLAQTGNVDGTRAAAASQVVDLGHATSVTSARAHDSAALYPTAAAPPMAHGGADVATTAMGGGGNRAAATAGGGVDNPNGAVAFTTGPEEPLIELPSPLPK